MGGHLATLDSDSGWWAVEISCHPEIKKAALWRLRGSGHRACAVTHSDDRVSIWAFVDAGAYAPAEFARFWLGLNVDAEHRSYPVPEVSWQRVDDWDWPESVKCQMTPKNVGRRLTIVPSGVSTEDSTRIPIHLDGRFGFGVGGVHPTTSMCLEVLEDRLSAIEDSPGITIADIGCGSGILGIAAIRLGAERVYAVDTKAASVRGTVRNRDMNGIDPTRLVVERGSVSEVGKILERPVDGFVCNILTKIIMFLIPRFEDICGENSWGILSGIRESELPLLERPLEEHGWKTTDLSQNEGWCCLEIARK